MKWLVTGVISLFIVIMISEIKAEWFYGFGVILAIFALVSLIVGCIKLISQVDHE